MDNQKFVITSVGRSGLQHVLAAIWDVACPGDRATHYRVVKLKCVTKYYQYQSDTSNGVAVAGHESRYVEDESGTPTLILYWHEEEGSTRLPYTLGVSEAGDFIAHWLSEADYGCEPDHDGSNDKGWCMFVDDWGHVLDSGYAIVAVQPEWAMYGK